MWIVLHVWTVVVVCGRDSGSTIMSYTSMVTFRHFVLIVTTVILLIMLISNRVKVSDNSNQSTYSSHHVIWKSNANRSSDLGHGTKKSNENELLLKGSITGTLSTNIHPINSSTDSTKTSNVPYGSEKSKETQRHKICTNHSVKYINSEKVGEWHVVLQNYQRRPPPRMSSTSAVPVASRTM